ncbi:unnamed protein product [Meloidogyne enterolobii]|uniref:Uncharacterized protein n=1 Tax=Meloidogyne enterolobii TaxID=390850 RepID=A0ACB1AZ76_MELEN
MISIIHPPTEIPEFVSVNGRRNFRLSAISNTVTIDNNGVTTAKNNLKNKYSKTFKTTK